MELLGRGNFVVLVLWILSRFQFVLSQGNTNRSESRLQPIPRSIVDSHPDGSNRTCIHAETFRQWLPGNYRPDHSGGHYHLLLAVSDGQLAFLINWLAIAFSFGYLPSHRVLIHFACHGPLSRLFVEHHLLQECSREPQRTVHSNETTWHHVVKHRLGSFLDIVLNLDETDWGALIFDLDAPWIRNMLPVFDYFGQEKMYDFMAQGSIQDEKYGGRVLANFGGAFIKNSAAGKALAARAKAALNSDWSSNWPDQDCLTKVLMADGKASQEPLAPFKALTTSSTYYNDHCRMHPNTCTWLASGVEGNFTFEPIAGTSETSPIRGTYSFFPQVVAPHNCDHICSDDTVLFQHCGLANCIRGGVSDIPCEKIPEFILTTHNVHKIMRPPGKHNFKPAPHGTFDSRTLQHMMETVNYFVDHDRFKALCAAYPTACKDAQSLSA